MYNKIFLVVLLASASIAGPLALDTDNVSKFFEVTQPEARVVGGTPAPEGSVPYMVALVSGTILRSFSCGASLITVRHVLTAGHCLDGFYFLGSLSSSLRGTIGTNRWNSGGYTFGFLRNISHPHYVRQTIKNDIAIAVTSTRVELTPVVNQITLDFNHVHPGTPARVHGWGRVSASGAISATLLQLDLTTLDNDVCQEEVHRISAQLNTVAPPIEGHIEVCTFHSVGHGVCNGDSGSALVRRSNGAQIGIVSWGFACAIGAPDMFVRLEPFREFVLEAISRDI